MIYDSRVGILDLKAFSLKDKLESDEIDKLIVYLKPLMTNARDRNTINANNYQFYFIKIFTSKGIKIHEDILTKETVKAHGIKSVSATSGIIPTCLMIYNCMSNDLTVKTAGLVTAGVSNILNRTNSIFSHCYGDDDKDRDTNKDKEDQEDKESGFTIRLNRRDKTSQRWTPLTVENMNKNIGNLNKNGRDDSNNLYKNNQKFRDEIINFAGDKAGLSNDKIIDKSYKYNTLNTLSKENLNKFIWSRDNTRFLIEILASYK